jgi:hypothetical protein
MKRRAVGYPIRLAVFVYCEPLNWQVVSGGFTKLKRAPTSCSQIIPREPVGKTFVIRRRARLAVDRPSRALAFKNRGEMTRSWRLAG